MKSPVSLFILLLSLFPSALGALLAVDYGTEWTKASLIKPGQPLDVLLDKDSKRKMQSVLGYKRDERVFGGEAVNAATRFPLAHFPYVKPLIALPGLPPANISSIYPSQPLYDAETQTLYFQHDSAPAYALNGNDTSGKTTWLPEEILAHELNYIKALASSAAKEPVTDLFLTIPSYFTQHQRKAFKDAAEIAGLSLVGSVGEGAAVGLNYAMTRQFPKLNEAETAWNKNGAQIDVIYDSGAMKTTATVLAFYTADVAEEAKTTISKSGKKSKLRAKSNPTTHVHVLATSSEPTLGGVQIDQALGEILVKDVAQKLKITEQEVLADDRAMRKLWKEAARTKAILSANQEASVNIESLMNDEDYRSRISRTQLEDACASFANKFAGPIQDALLKAGLQITDINSLILFGGNTRVPFVQTAIKAALGGNEDKIAQNVNTDEAAVLGAAYYGASQGRSVVSKLKLKVVEGLGWDVAYSVADGQDWKIVSDENAESYRDQVLFPAGTNHTTKRVLTLARTSKAQTGDRFSVKFAYTGINAPNPAELVQVDIRDIEKAFTNMTESEIASSQIKLTMRVDSRGFVQAASAVAYIPASPKEKESVKDKLKGLFSSSNKDEADKADEVLKNLEAELEELENSGDKERKVALKFSETALGVKPLSAEVKKQAKARLAAINKVEAEVSARAEGRNLLEGYLYRLSGLLGPDAPSDALHRFGTDEERAKLNAGVQEAFEWMNEEAETADVATLLKKRSSLEAIELPIIRRYQEAITRPKAIDDFQKVMSAARIFFVDAQRNLTQAQEADEPSRHSQEELDGLFAKLKENETWMSEKMVLHKQIEDFTVDPVLLTADLNDRGKALQMMVIRLGNKRIPKAKPKKITTSTATNESTDVPEGSASATSSTVETSATATPAAEPSSDDVPVHEEL